MPEYGNKVLAKRSCHFHTDNARQKSSGVEHCREEVTRRSPIFYPSFYKSLGGLDRGGADSREALTLGGALSRGNRYLENVPRLLRDFCGN